MIKTIELIANVEKKINILGGTHVKIKNLGDSTVYVSKHSGIVAGADNVKSIQSSSAEILIDVATYSIENSTGDYRGTIYALADSDCSIELETTNNANFSLKLKGGDEESISITLDDMLKSNLTYQLGILTSDITLTLPERANSDIEVDFAITDVVHNINCDYLSLNTVANTYYQVIFSYDKSLSRWFSSVISSDYNSTSTILEVEDNESN